MAELILLCCTVNGQVQYSRGIHGRPEGYLLTGVHLGVFQSRYISLCVLLTIALHKSDEEREWKQERDGQKLRLGFLEHTFMHTL